MFEGSKTVDGKKQVINCVVSVKFDCDAKANERELGRRR